METKTPYTFQVLNDLYHLLRFETCKSIHRAFEVVLSAMDRHLRVKHMQISGRFELLPKLSFSINVDEINDVFFSLHFCAVQHFII